MTTADILSFALGKAPASVASSRSIELRELFDDLRDCLSESLNAEQQHTLDCLYDVYENVCGDCFDNGFVYGIQTASRLREFMIAPGEARAELHKRCKKIKDTVPEAVELRHKYLKSKKRSDSR